MKHVHFEEIGQLPNGVYNDYSDKNIYGHSALDQPVYIIKKNGHKKDIDEIDNTKIPKLEFFQDKSVFVKLAKYD